MSKYVEKIGLPCTDYNTGGSNNYAKLCNIKTHIINNNANIEQTTFDTRALLFFNVFSFTGSSFEQTNLIIRLKTSEAESSNKIFWTKVPKNFKIVYIIENDGSYTFYANCNTNEKVKLQLIEGCDGFVKYYYQSKFVHTLSGLTIKEPTIVNETFGNEGSCSIKINSTNTGIIIDTVAGGDGIQPSRNGSISLGSVDKRFKGGYFTEQVCFPALYRKVPTTTLANGTTFFETYSKKLVTYYEGKWYCNGTEVSIT